MQPHCLNFGYVNAFRIVHNRLPKLKVHCSVNTHMENCHYFLDNTKKYYAKLLKGFLGENRGCLEIVFPSPYSQDMNENEVLSG